MIQLRDRLEQHLQPLVRTHRPEEPEAQRPRRRLRIPRASLIEGRATRLAVDLIEVRLAQANPFQLGFDHAHRRVRLEQEVARGQDRVGRVQRLHPGDAPPAVVVHDLQVHVGAKELLVLIDRRGFELTRMLPRTKREIMPDLSLVVRMAVRGYRLEPEAQLGVHQVMRVQRREGRPRGHELPLLPARERRRDPLGHAPRGLRPRDAEPLLQHLPVGAPAPHFHRVHRRQAPHAALPPVIIHAHPRLVVQQIHLRTYIPVVVRRHEHGARRVPLLDARGVPAPDRGDQIEPEPFQRVDVHDLRAHLVEPAEHQLGLLGAVQFGAEVDEVRRGRRQVRRVPQVEAVDPRPRLPRRDVRLMAAELVRVPRLQIEHLVPREDQPAGELRRAQVIPGPLPRLRRQPRPPHDRDFERSVRAGPRRDRARRLTRRGGGRARWAGRVSPVAMCVGLG